MESAVKTILIVDDESNVLRDYNAGLNGHRVLLAKSASEARVFFEAYANDIDMMVFDGYLIGDPEGTSEKLIKEVHESGFMGAMVAASGDRYMRADQRDWGCTHTLSDKTDTATLLRILDQTR